MIDRPFLILIDTREKKPYKFTDSSVVTLETGDYSIDGYKDRIAIERKSKTDIYQSIGRNRNRFEREVIRLTEFKYSALVIESNLNDLNTPPPRTKMSPKAVINSLLSWSVEYNLPIFFCPNRRYARAVVLKLLNKFWKLEQEAEKINVKRHLG